MVTSCLLPRVMKPFQEGVYPKRSEFAPYGANSFLLGLTLIEKGGKYENGRVSSPKSAPIVLK